MQECLNNSAGSAASSCHATRFSSGDALEWNENIAAVSAASISRATRFSSGPGTHRRVLQGSTLGIWPSFTNKGSKMSLVSGLLASSCVSPNRANIASGLSVTSLKSYDAAD